MCASGILNSFSVHYFNFISTKIDDEVIGFTKLLLYVFNKV